MAVTRVLVVLCVSAFLLMSVPAVAALPVSLPPVEAATNPGCDNLTVLHIGGGALASQVVDRLVEMGAGVINWTGIAGVGGLGPEVVVIFGGEWFEQRIYDTALDDFLRLAWSRDAKLVMAGGTTSRFFEALDKAGILEIPVTEAGEVRNPAYDNPSVVGLGMKTVDGRTGPSLLFSNTSSPEVLGESLVGWLASLPVPQLQFGPYAVGPDPIPAAIFSNSTPGTYSLVGGDEWGALVILHFTVS
jgi:hypothetical protein